jgi:hypothetical protein
MRTCVLCGGEAEIHDLSTVKQVGCPDCLQYAVADAFCAELADDAKMRASLSRVTRHHTHKGSPISLLNRVQAEWAIVDLEEFEQDVEQRDRLAIDALTGAGPAEDPWDAPIRAAAKTLGISPSEARGFAADIEARGRLRIASLPSSGAIPGAEPSHERYCWEECSPRADRTID